MIVTVNSHAGNIVNLDLREQLGGRVELDCFQFVIPPIEFRLVRNGVALQDWQAGNIQMYDLQHPAGTQDWSRDGHRFRDQPQEGTEQVTCGVQCNGLAIETRGLGFSIVVLVWPREGTVRMKRSKDERLPTLENRVP